MNKISNERKKQILNLLVEGMSLRAISRVTNTHRTTIMKLMVRIGRGCEKLLEDNMKGFHSKYLQADEIWTFCQKKQHRLKGREIYDSEKGDQYVFIALDPESKLIPVFTVGKRNTKNTDRFISALKDKLNGNGRVQLTTDQFPPYENVVEEYFGCEIDYAQQTKFYVSEPDSRGRYSPPRVSDVVSKIIQGKPNKEKITTSHVESHNLTMRMSLRRFTRLCTGYSKKLENLKASVALYFAYYNFVKIHSTLRMTPAMQAGIADTIWTWDEILAYEN